MAKVLLYRDVAILGYYVWYVNDRTFNLQENTT